MAPADHSPLEEALVYALRAHAGQTRKQTDVPYYSHLISVTALVMEHGGGQTEAVAALLHDAVEDAGGEARLADIRKTFGREVADIVEACSDTMETPKPPWRMRKERYLGRLKIAPASVRLISAADKLHNLRSIATDYHQIGEDLWERFSAGREDQLWYYGAVIEILRPSAPSRLVDELERTLANLRQLIEDRG